MFNKWFHSFQLTLYILLHNKTVKPPGKDPPNKDTSLKGALGSATY